MLEGVPYFINGTLQLELITAVETARAYQINGKTVAIFSSVWSTTTVFVNRLFIGVFCKRFRKMVV